MPGYIPGKEGIDENEVADSDTGLAPALCGSAVCRAGLPDQAGPHRGHLPARRVERRDGARAVRSAAEGLGQAVVVDNKPGAGGTIAATEIVRAAPDGYNLLMSNTTPISLAPFMLDPQPYDFIKSFTHVALVATVPDVVMAHPSVPAKDMAELISWIRAQNKKVFFGSGGVGSIGHILGETFKKETGS